MVAAAWELDVVEPHAPRTAVRTPPGRRPARRQVCRPARPASREHAGVYRRRRVAAVVVACAVAAAVAALAGVAAVTAGGSAQQEQADRPRSSAPHAIVVGPGETLWDLVRPHAPAGADATVYVAEVAARNHVDPRALLPGTVLRLPPPEE